MAYLTARVVLHSDAYAVVDVVGDVRVSADGSEYDVTLLHCLDGWKLSDLSDSEKEQAKDQLADAMRAEEKAGGSLPYVLVMA
jgi:hypothetical protein